MTPNTMEDLHAFVRLVATPDGERLLAWLRQSRIESVETVLRCASSRLPAARGYAAALADLCDVLETAPEMIRASQRIREDRRGAALVGEYP